jgi:hypothetical protein
MLTICLVQVAHLKALHAFGTRRELTLGACGIPILFQGMLVFGAKTLPEPLVLLPLSRGPKRKEADRNSDE